MSRLLFDELCEVMEPPLARALLDEALKAEKMNRVPSHPAALRFFVTGALRRVAVEQMGLAHFDVVVGRIGRRIMDVANRRPAFSSGTRFKNVPGDEDDAELYDMPIADPELAHRLMVVSLDAHLCVRLAAQLPGQVAVSRVETMFDLSPLLELGPGQSSAIIVDGALTPVALPTLARMAHVIPPVCPVVVFGITAERWERFVAHYPAAADWQHVETLEEIEPGALLPFA